MSGLVCGFMPTFNRPELLGRAIACFLNQTYENRYLVILDDLGMYSQQRGDRWELVSVRRRFVSLGEKSNAIVAMAPRGTSGLLKVDDDDLLYPWHFEAMAEALSRGDWVQPRLALDYVNGRLVQQETFNWRFPRHFAYHSQWGYRAGMFVALGGYRRAFAGDDGELQVRAWEAGYESVDIDRARYQPSMIYNRPLPGRISEAGGSEAAYFNQAPAEPRWVGKVVIPDSVEYPEIPTEVLPRGW